MVRHHRNAALAVALAFFAADGTASAQEQRKFADAQARLGLNLAAAAAAEKEAKGRNLVISPFSLASVLAVIRNGFTDEARAAMGEEVGIESDEELQAFLKFSEDLNGTDQVSVASGVWVDQKVKLKPLAESYFRNAKAPIQVLDLSKQESVVAINKWASDKTNGAIKEAIKDLPSATEIVGTSALYFKSDWARKFSKANTKKAQFTPAVGAPRDVDFMTQDAGRTLYRESEAFKAVDLPYKDGRFSFVVLMPENKPNRETALQQTVAFKKLENADGFLSWLRGDGFEPRQGTFDLPKFTLATSYDYLPALARELTDNGKKRKIKNPQLTLYDIAANAELSELRQVATMTVDEEGTEAAAVSTATGSRSFDPPGYFRVSFNKPFIVALRDTKSGVILFMGLVQNVGDERVAGSPVKAQAGQQGR